MLWNLKQRNDMVRSLKKDCSASKTSVCPLWGDVSYGLRNCLSVEPELWWVRSARQCRDYELYLSEWGMRKWICLGFSAWATAVSLRWAILRGPETRLEVLMGQLVGMQVECRRDEAGGADWALQSSWSCAPLRVLPPLEEGDVCNWALQFENPKSKTFRNLKLEEQCGNRGL